jgi:hypothetical protein
MSLISRFGTTYTVRRRDPGSYVNGHWQPAGTWTEFDIVASIQPLRGKEMELLPEGERSKEMVRIYTKSGLRQTIEQQDVKGDLVSYKGRQYEVKSVEEWEFSWDGLAHFKAIAVLVEDD